MSDTAYGIESFEVVDDGGADRLVRLNGWFYSRNGVTGMQLALPNHPLPIEEFTLPSEGLLELFGEAGRHCRFRLEARAPADIPFEQGRLLAVIKNNDGVMIDVSEMLTYARADSVPLTDQVAPIPAPPQAEIEPTAPPVAAAPQPPAPEPAPEPPAPEPPSAEPPPPANLPAHTAPAAEPPEAPVFAPRDPVPEERRKQLKHAARNIETESWRFLTGDAEPDAEPPAPVSEIPPDPDARPSLLGRLLGRKPQDSR